MNTCLVNLANNLRARGFEVVENQDSLEVMEKFLKTDFIVNVDAALNITAKMEGVLSFDDFAAVESLLSAVRTERYRC